MDRAEKQRLLEATERAMAKARAQTPEEARADLIAIGILDEDGELSSRYGGPGKMTWPAGMEPH